MDPTRTLASPAAGGHGAPDVGDAVGAARGPRAVDDADEATDAITLDLTDAATRTAGADDDAELRAVVEELARPAYRLALAIVRDPALAEDVVQETLVKVWTSLDSFRGESSLRSWGLRIAHNVAVSTLRQARDVATDPNLLPERAQRVGPERHATGRLAVEELVGLLDAMDPLSRSIVVLREIEAMSYDEIALALDVPVPTVKTRLLRARRHLANALGDWR